MKHIYYINKFGDNGFIIKQDDRIKSENFFDDIEEISYTYNSTSKQVTLKCCFMIELKPISNFYKPSVVSYNVIKKKMDNNFFHEMINKKIRNTMDLAKLIFAESINKMILNEYEEDVINEIKKYIYNYNENNIEENTKNIVFDIFTDKFDKTLIKLEECLRLFVKDIKKHNIHMFSKKYMLNTFYTK